METRAITIETWEISQRQNKKIALRFYLTIKKN